MKRAPSRDVKSIPELVTDAALAVLVSVMFMVGVVSLILWLMFG